MHLFMPKTVVFEPASLQYPLGDKIYRYFQNKPVEIIKSSLSAFSRSLADLNEQQVYARSKTILIITRNQQKKLNICKPSADYQFALVSNCPGSCEYCYLQTNQSYKPYMKAYVNLDEIWETLLKHIPIDSSGYITFEAASNGDPLAIEHITGSVGEFIERFGYLEKGRLRIVTKYDQMDLLSGKKHHGHTHFRISVNTDYVIRQFEHGTSTMEARLNAAEKLACSGFPLGFIVAPIMMHENWQNAYRDMFRTIHRRMGSSTKTVPTFEFIQHRFTKPAKDRILKRFPKTKLDMDEEKRELKWGKYGRYKYVYPKKDAKALKDYMVQMLEEYFPESPMEYFT